MHSSINFSFEASTKSVLTNKQWIQRVRRSHIIQFNQKSEFACICVVLGRHGDDGEGLRRLDCSDGVHGVKRCHTVDSMGAPDSSGLVASCLTQDSSNAGLTQCKTPCERKAVSSLPYVGQHRRVLSGAAVPDSWKRWVMQCMVRSSNAPWHGYFGLGIP